MQKENRHPVYLSTTIDVFNNFKACTEYLRGEKIPGNTIMIDVNDFSYQTDGEILAKINAFMRRLKNNRLPEKLWRAEQKARLHCSWAFCFGNSMRKKAFRRAGGSSSAAQACRHPNFAFQHTAVFDDGSFRSDIFLVPTHQHFPAPQLCAFAQRQADHARAQLLAALAQADAIADMVRTKEQFFVQKMPDVHRVHKNIALGIQAEPVGIRHIFARGVRTSRLSI